MAILPCSATDFAKECARRAVISAEGSHPLGLGPAASPQKGSDALLQTPQPWLLQTPPTVGGDCSTWEPCQSDQLRCTKEIQEAGVNCVECTCFDESALLGLDESALLGPVPDPLPPTKDNGANEASPQNNAVGVAGGFPPLGPGPVIVQPPVFDHKTADCGCICPGPGFQCMAIYKCTPEERASQLSMCPPTPDAPVALLESAAESTSDPTKTYCLGPNIGPLLQCERFDEDYVKVQYKTCYQYECMKKE